MIKKELRQYIPRVLRTLTYLGVADPEKAAITVLTRAAKGKCPEGWRVEAWLSGLCADLSKEQKRKRL